MAFWIVIGLVLCVCAIAYVFTLRGRRLDELIVSGDLAKIRKELVARPEAFRPRRGGSSGPLHLAAERGQTAVVRLLVEHRVDVHARDIHGNTPLHMAALSERNAEIARLLVAHGADLNARNDQGYTPLAVALARKKRRMADLLVSLGAQDKPD